MSPGLTLTVIALCAVVFACGVQHGERRKPHRHTDPCLHEQGMAGHKTWKPADPSLFKGRYGKALEWHLGGVAWYLATMPTARHSCKPQTCGLTESLQHFDRCACGATRFGVWGAWEGRNSRA